MQKTVAILLAALVLTLSGCAKSPQQVRLSPNITVDSYVSNQPTVYLTITDNRPSKSLGTRGGVYRGTNDITLSKDLTSTLRPVATAALNEMGVIVDDPSPKPIKLELIVEKLEYKVNENQTLPIEVSLHTKISAIADSDGKQQATQYQSSKLHKFFTAPNAEDNATIINEIVSETLTRLFNDPKLVSLLR
ncbi:MAG: YajG family lipoprotein [Motiliproteus sp.]